MMDSRTDHRKKPGTTVMTGGTSGLGRVALEQMLKNGRRVILSHRGQVPPGAEGFQADLARLEGAFAFAEDVKKGLSGEDIDALVLNAGGQGMAPAKAGYDSTFVLNYLSHYVLVERLWDHLGEGARVVLTTSGTHDPAEGSRVPPPKHANAMWLAEPSKDPELDDSVTVASARAYASAKLCVVLYARTLARRAADDPRGIRVYTYDPGPTPGTGLARHFPPLLRMLWESFPWLLRWMLRKKANTVSDAGAALAAVAQGEQDIPHDVVYVALRRGAFTYPPFSSLAKSEAHMKALERDSQELVAYMEKQS